MAFLVTFSAGILKKNVTHNLQNYRELIIGGVQYYQMSETQCNNFTE